MARRARPAPPINSVPVQLEAAKMLGSYRERLPRLWAKRAEAVIEAEAASFTELVKLSGLDPAKHLRLADWSDIDFSGADLRGYDFSGAKLRNCHFDGAEIEGARFDQAEINGTNLRAAKDWDTYVRNWLRSDRVVDDRYLPEGAVFQDAPFAPEMVVIPPGRFMMGSPQGEEGR